MNGKSDIDGAVFQLAMVSGQAKHTLQDRLKQGEVPRPWSGCSQGGLSGAYHHHTNTGCTSALQSKLSQASPEQHRQECQCDLAQVPSSTSRLTSSPELPHGNTASRALAGGAANHTPTSTQQVLVGLIFSILYCIGRPHLHVFPQG